MHEEDNSIEFQKGNGWRARLTGPTAPLYLLLLSQIGVMAYMTFFLLKHWLAAGDVGPILRAHAAEMERQHQAVQLTLEEIVYLQSVCLNPARRHECEVARVPMPPSLAARIQRNR